MPTVSQHYKQRPPVRGGVPHDADPGVSLAPVVLMVSGGADSTALLLLACTSSLDIADGRGLARIARERIHVLHVNHHLRGADADSDEQFVRELCARFGVPLCVEHASFTDLAGQNLEAAARDVRYAAARRYVRELSEEMGAPRSAARILTAHTASDRVETFFMNAIKGSGPAGLSSIPRRRNIIVRPLIDKTHEELCRYLSMAGQGWREDATNQDTTYLRNFVRHLVVPLVSERNTNLAHTMGSTCEILGDEDAFLSQLAQTALRSCTRRSEEGLMVLDARRLAAAEIVIARRMVRLAVRALDSEIRLEMHHIERVLALVAAGAGSCTLPGGLDARIEFGTLTFSDSTARERAVAGWLVVPGAMPLGNGKVIEAELELLPAGTDAVSLARAAALGADENDGAVLLVDAAALGYVERDLVRLKENTSGSLPAETQSARLWVDSYEPGDMMCPLGMRGRSKKVSDILGEARVPVADRPHVPVVRTAPGGSIVWLAGVRSDERFRCTASTRVLVKLKMRNPGD